jgi:hypothetical protein
MEKLAERIRAMPSRRDPPYRPAATIDDAERDELARKLGDAANYDLAVLRQLVLADPGNLEFRKALISGIVSAEFAGIDSFSRKVCEWQDWPVPWSLIMAMARQTWDEVRHAWLGKELLESYGGELGEYPDTLAGGGAAGAVVPDGVAEALRDPVISLSMTNVSLEGAALQLFRDTSLAGRRIGDRMMEHVFDYNWADEVTHTAIGDYFIKLLVEGKPEEEKKALRAHGLAEAFRARLSAEQTEELRAFFAEELGRGLAALGTGAVDSTSNGAAG